MCPVRGKCDFIFKNSHFIIKDVPYYCPSCDVNVRRANKAKKQAQAKELKAKAQLAESRRVETLPKIASKQATSEEGRVADYDNSTSDDDNLVIDIARNKSKPTKRKNPQTPLVQSPEKKSSSVITQPLPQLEVCYSQRKFIPFLNLSNRR